MSILNEIVKESLGLHPLVQIDAIIEPLKPDRPYGIIKEGLIKTYPIEQVIEAMARVFNLKIVNKSEINRIYSSIKSNTFQSSHNGYVAINQLNSKVLTFVVGGGGFNKDVLDQYMNKYGYFLCNKAEWSDEWTRYQYEKKFDIDVTDIILKQQFIYHICPSKLKDKILKQGLVPHKSKYPRFNNDSRLYFFIKNKEDIEWKFIMYASGFRCDKNTEDKYMLLEIDTSKIAQEIKFYADPRMTDGIYTLQGIAPNAIKILNEEA